MAKKQQQKKQWHKTGCVLCAQNWGLKVRVEEGRMVKVLPDRDNPRSLGYACRKGLNLLYHQYPDDRWRCGPKKSFQTTRNGSGRYTSVPATPFAPIPTPRLMNGRSRPCPLCWQKPLEKDGQQVRVTTQGGCETGELHEWIETNSSRSFW
ncbi:MAG: hypothetical protein KKC20_03150 [Proteobacteria bacterium]|nr:hypothetical protein [Pseudomonadota bacterium]